MRVVIDASTIVGAALKSGSIPRQALLAARDRHIILLSEPVFAEIDIVLARPKFAQAITPEVRADIIGLLTVAAAWVKVDISVQSCRDPKDNMYLELAAAGHADLIVSSDEDLLVLHPWRGVRILRPRPFLAEVD